MGIGTITVGLRSGDVEKLMRRVGHLGGQISNTISRKALSAGAGLIKRDLVSEAMSHGYRNFAKSLGVAYTKGRGALFHKARIGAITRYKKVYTNTDPGKKQTYKKVAKSVAEDWRNRYKYISHFLEYGTKPHLIRVVRTRLDGTKWVQYWRHPGAKAIPMFRPVANRSLKLAYSVFRGKLKQQVELELAKHRS